MGLTRLRSFTLADAHIICRPDQAQDEINGALNLIEKIATTFGLVKGRHYSYRLSLSGDGDSSKYFDDPKHGSRPKTTCDRCCSRGAMILSRLAMRQPFTGQKLMFR